MKKITMWYRHRSLYYYYHFTDHGPHFIPSPLGPHCKDSDHRDATDKLWLGLVIGLTRHDDYHYLYSCCEHFVVVFDQVRF